MTSGMMIILLLLMTMFLRTGLTAIVGFEAVENHLLMKLGMNRRPVADKNVRIPSATMKLYRAMLEENTMTTHFPLPGLHTSSANTVRTYPDQGSVPSNPKSQRYRLQFDISALPERERVKAAEVRITMSFDSERRRDDEFVHILVHDIVKPGARGLSKPTLRLMDSKSLRLSSSTSESQEISFDVTPAMERLSETNFDENHGVLIECVTVSGSRTRLIDVFDFRSSAKPLLMVYTDDGTSQRNALADVTRRTKRSADEPKKKPKKKKICQRLPLYVDFRDVGFSDWIHAPQGYDAYYCHGECTFPLANHMNASNHAVMQTLMNSINPLAVPKACCIPTKLRPETLLYVDDDQKLVMKTYPDMVVDECGCR